MYTETNRQLSYRKWIWDVHLLRNGFKSSRYDKVSHAHTHTHKRQQNDKTISPIIFSSVNRDTTTKAQPHKLIELNGKISQFPHNSIFRPLYLFCFSVIVYSHLRVIPLHFTHSFSVSTPPNSHTHTQFCTRHFMDLSEFPTNVSCCCPSVYFFFLSDWFVSVFLSFVFMCISVSFTHSARGSSFSFSGVYFHCHSFLKHLSLFFVCVWGASPPLPPRRCWRVPDCRRHNSTIIRLLSGYEDMVYTTYVKGTSVL